MSQAGYKFFTLKVHPDVHLAIKKHCLRNNISMRDFAIQAFLENLKDDLEIDIMKIRDIFESEGKEDQTDART